MVQEEELLRKAVLRFNGRLVGLIFGLIAGIGLFVATNILVLKGGNQVGPHLILLAQFFPGYRVTFVGSIVGFVYAAVVGFVIGWVLGAVYNKFASA
jgi:tetrahydromethanopterin S-methyltransferase subunit G